MSSASPLLPQAMHDGQNMPQHLDLDVVQQQPRPSPSRRSTSASHFKGPTSEEDQTIYPPQKEEQPWHSSITLGLVIHSLADGISLGASALASAAVDGVNLSIVVFLAILVGIASALLSPGLSHILRIYLLRRSTKHLQPSASPLLCWPTTTVGRRPSAASSSSPSPPPSVLSSPTSSSVCWAVAGCPVKPATGSCTGPAALSSSQQGLSYVNLVF